MGCGLEPVERSQKASLWIAALEAANDPFPQSGPRLHECLRARIAVRHADLQLERFSKEVSEMLAAPKRLGSIRLLACSVRRLAEQGFPAGRRKSHAGTRALPRPVAPSAPSEPTRLQVHEAPRAQWPGCGVEEGQGQGLFLADRVFCLGYSEKPFGNWYSRCGACTRPWLRVRVELVGNRLGWVTREGGKEVRFASEPEASLSKRIKVRVLSWLPIENLL